MTAPTARPSSSCSGFRPGRVANDASGFQLAVGNVNQHRHSGVLAPRQRYRALASLMNGQTLASGRLRDSGRRDGVIDAPCLLRRHKLDISLMARHDHEQLPLGQAGDQRLADDVGREAQRRSRPDRRQLFRRRRSGDGHWRNHDVRRSDGADQLAALRRHGLHNTVIPLLAPILNNAFGGVAGTSNAVPDLRGALPDWLRRQRRHLPCRRDRRRGGALLDRQPRCRRIHARQSILPIQACHTYRSRTYHIRLRYSHVTATATVLPSGLDTVGIRPSQPRSMSTTRTSQYR